MPSRVSISSRIRSDHGSAPKRSEEHTSELQSRSDLVCRLLLEKKKKKTIERQVVDANMNDSNDIKKQVRNKKKCVSGKGDGRDTIIDVEYSRQQPAVVSSTHD